MNLNKPLIYSLFLILPFGQLERVVGLPLYLHDLIILGLLIFNLKNLKLSKPLILFIGSAAFSLILATFKLPFPDLITASFYLFRFTAIACLLPVFQIAKFNLKPWLKYLCLALAVFGLLQYLFLPDTRFLAQLNWDDHFFRLIGTIFDPSYLGLVLVLGLILFNFQLLPSLILLLSLFLTYSRSSYLSLLLVIIALAIIKKKFKYLLFILIFGLLFFLPRQGGEGVKLERLFSITQRFDNYQEGIILFQKSPLIGLGFNTLRFYRQDYISRSAAGLDSSLLFVLATTGIVGFGFYINWLRSLWSKSVLVKLSLIAILVHSCFQNSFFYPLILIWLFALLSLGKKEI
ncbi:MAG: O-antigen ligase family protein [Candidatus Beckwithbacteria bacterium]